MNNIDQMKDLDFLNLLFLVLQPTGKKKTLTASNREHLTEWKKYKQEGK